MIKTYQTRWGIYFSLFIAALSSVPRLIQIDVANLQQLFFSIAYIFSSMLICWHLHQYFLAHQFNSSTLNQPRIRAFSSIGFGMAVIIIISIVFRTYNELLFFNQNNLSITQAVLTVFFRSGLMSSLCYFAIYYLNVNLQLQRSRLENEHLKQESLRAQLFSLQQQVSPHFLFNSLSTLKTIAPDNETKTYVMQLANVYRYLLTFHDHQRITVKEELAFMTSYLYILQERYEDALMVTINIQDELLSYYIPPISLQILIENAIKHNVISADEPLKINIHTDNRPLLTVENTYQPKFSVEEGNGKGLQNINERYRLLAGKQIGVLQHNGSFVVTLPLLAP